MTHLTSQPSSEDTVHNHDRPEFTFLKPNET